MLTRKSEGAVDRRVRRIAGSRVGTMDRRTFLKRSGLVAGAGAFASQLPNRTIDTTSAAQAAETVKREVHRTVCTHCSVGCSIDAVVENAVGVGHERVCDPRRSLGGHCVKGAAVREAGHGEYRLKSPMKLVDGKDQKISCEQAINEVGDKRLALKKDAGPDSVCWVGSSKLSN